MRRNNEPENRVYKNMDSFLNDSDLNYSKDVNQNTSMLFDQMQPATLEELQESLRAAQDQVEKITQELMDVKAAIVAKGKEWEVKVKTKDKLDKEESEIQFQATEIESLYSDSLKAKRNTALTTRKNNFIAWQEEVGTQEELAATIKKLDEEYNQLVDKSLTISSALAVKKETVTKLTEDIKNQEFARDKSFAELLYSEGIKNQEFATNKDFAELHIKNQEFAINKDFAELPDPEDIKNQEFARDKSFAERPKPESKEANSNYKIKWQPNKGQMYPKKSSPQEEVDKVKNNNAFKKMSVGKEEIRPGQTPHQSFLGKDQGEKTNQEEKGWHK